MAVKYIFVTGGVVSGLGKGITCASLGRLLKARGLKISFLKLDPYININPGKMSPVQHGESFVTEDGTETDMDIGHYERFTGQKLEGSANSTAGRIYWDVILKERAGDYGGGTVQIVPHITNEIKNKIYGAAGNSSDVVIVEVGGTVGDVESLPFLEAIREIASEVGRENCLYIQVALIPFLAASGEIKTKPVQHSVKELLSIGIQPDIVVCRTKKPIDDAIKNKLGLFCNISGDDVIETLTAETVYEIPLIYEEQGFASRVCEKLGLNCKKPDLSEWKEFVDSAKNAKKEVTVALVGKDVKLHDAYISVRESLVHAGAKNKCRVNIKWVDAHSLNDENAGEVLADADGIISPTGSGFDGADGQIAASKYARENNKPFLGIGFGMELAVIEFARNVCKIEDAASTEFNADAAEDVVYRPKDRPKFPKYDDTERKDMRRGALVTVLDKTSDLYNIYKEEKISERHCHQYEINPEFTEVLKKGGMKISGVSEKEGFVDAVELPNHKWYKAVIYNPQFNSRPNHPSKLIDAFVSAVL